MAEVSLIIKSEKAKQSFFDLLKYAVKIPVCKNCGKLFSLGFPNNETGICDRLICEENYLLCECEYFKIVQNLYLTNEDGIVDVFKYYEIVNPKL